MKVQGLFADEVPANESDSYEAVSGGLFRLLEPQVRCRLLALSDIPLRGRIWSLSGALQT
jgi:hypothetical protein